MVTNVRMEVSEEKQTALIVCEGPNALTDLLKEELGKYNVDVFFSSRLPKNDKKFHYGFFINVKKGDRIMVGRIQKAVYIFFGLERIPNSLIESLSTHHKVISIEGNVLRKEDVDKILWFSLSQTRESILRFSVPRRVLPHTSVQDRRTHVRIRISMKQALFLFFSALFLSHVLFVIPLATSSYFFSRAADALKHEDFPASTQYSKTARVFLRTAKKLYSFSRPTFLLFSLAMLPDDIITINEKADEIIRGSSLVVQNSAEVIKLFFKKNKAPEEKDTLLLRINTLQEEVESLEKNCSLLNQKVPTNIPSLQKVKKELSFVIEMLSVVKKLIPRMDFFMAKDTTRKFLLLFANNMELRPGGGFIGSFGVLTVHDYTFEDIRVYDVYDADGQLKAHIDPPEPIRLYLNQPHWFLRDSAFSPDFIENYSQAKFFLEREMNMGGFSGALLMTTTSIENVLGAFDSVYIPDFDENITQKNFYLKAQIYSEKDFFPGSIQKKSFLSSLTRQLFIRLEDVSPKNLLMEFKKSLDEKQMVLYVDDPAVQNILDSLYWSGTVIEPQCTAKIDNCIVDFLFPADANLGVNKANFFVKRQVSLKMNFDQDGTVHHSLSILFKNESAGDVFPGGTYKNYLQILLPRNTNVETVTKNDVLIENVDERNEEVKTIGFYFEVPPQKKTEIRVNYTLEEALKKGKGAYQLIIQKQIGSSNNDFGFQLHLPQNIFIVNQNFSPLVKNNNIIYNTNLSADKIFFVELLRE